MTHTSLPTSCWPMRWKTDKGIDDKTRDENRKEDDRRMIMWRLREQRSESAFRLYDSLPLDLPACGPVPFPSQKAVGGVSPPGSRRRQHLWGCLE